MPPITKLTFRLLSVLLLVGAFGPLLFVFAGVLALNWTETASIRAFVLALPLCAVCFFLLLSDYLWLRQKSGLKDASVRRLNVAIFFGGPIGLVIGVFQLTRSSSREE